jgi:hypothetical protein
MSLLLSLAVLAIVACGPCSILSRPPDSDPTPSIAVSEAAAQSLEQEIHDQFNTRSEGSFVLRITNEEATSYLQEQVAQSAEPSILDPKVWCTRGQVNIAGTFTNIIPITAAGRLTVVPKVVEGQVRIQIVEARLGSVKLPQFLLDQLAARMTDALSAFSPGLQFTDIQVLEGEIIIQGRL